MSPRSKDHRGGARQQRDDRSDRQRQHFTPLSVAGCIANKGAIDVTSDTEKLDGALSGTGTVDFFNDSTMPFGKTVGSGQTVTHHGAGGLRAFALSPRSSP